MAFKARDVFPAEDPLSEWLTVLAMAFNDLSLVNARLERDYDELHSYLYWLRLGVAHFTEAALYLEGTQDIAEVAAYVESLPDDARRHYKKCLALFEERRKELFLIRNSLFHYEVAISGEAPIRNALNALGEGLVTIKTGKLRDARLLFADDVAATIFTRATGVPWHEVIKDEVQEHVGVVQKHIEEAVTAFMRFANPALMEPISRAAERGVPLHKVEQVDPQDPRSGWKIIG